MIVGVQRFLDQLEADHDVKVVVFDSADEDYFISHYDLVRAEEVPLEPGPTGLPFPLHDIAVRLAQSSVISIASVRGRARGSGAEFIVSCDMSFASREKAILGHWEVGASAVPGAGGLSAFQLWLADHGLSRSSLDVRILTLTRPNAMDGSTAPSQMLSLIVSWTPLRHGSVASIMMR